MGKTKKKFFQKNSSNDKMVSSQKMNELLNLFRTEDSCLLGDDLVWEILMFSGVCRTGAYSMFFWIGCN